MRLRLLTAVVAVALLAGCQKAAEAPAPAVEPAAAPAAEAPPTEAVAEVAGFGVPECDTYVDEMLKCIDSGVPEATREQFRSSLEASRAAWQQAAATPEGRAGLAAACTQATAAAKTSMSAYGCAF